MKIKITPVPEEKLGKIDYDIMKVPFGEVFSDHMFTMKYSADKGWHSAEVRPFGDLALSPAAVVLHYSQEVFEGQKAYLSPDGDILLFRPRDNARRLNLSLRRMCMPEIDEDMFIQAEEALLRADRRWIPSRRGASLYLRAAVIGTEAAIGIRASKEYLFFIICSPVGPYFKDFSPIRVRACEEYIRAADGGTGEAKTGGNYAGSLLATMDAKRDGFSQIIWLDSSERRYVEEMGGMNIFFVKGDMLLTPPLSGTILRGITRDSVLRLAGELGLKAEEQRLDIEEILREADAGLITECFACGTAAVISPVGSISYKGREHVISKETGRFTRMLYDALTSLQYGLSEDTHGWMHVIK